jgi:hypothetical protein
MKTQKRSVNIISVRRAKARQAIVCLRHRGEGDPRVNIQRGKGGKAKIYQVKQVLAAIDRLLLQGKGEDDDGR